MAVLPLTQGAENPILRTVSPEIKQIDRKIKDLAKNMVDTMVHANGLGIAAPQVGVNARLFIALLNYGTKNEITVPMINPKILFKSDETGTAEEGCLSLPGRFGIVPRAKELTVEFTDLKGNKRILQLEGLNARVIQHETDHIDAHLFIDRMEKEIPKDQIKKKADRGNTK